MNHHPVNINNDTNSTEMNSQKHDHTDSSDNKDAKVTKNSQVDESGTRDAEVPGKEQKKNFSKAEDVQICHSYATFCIHSITGERKKGKILWTDIAQHFKESLSNQDYVCLRTPGSIRNRWLNHIQPKTLKFAEVLRSTAKKDTGSKNNYDVSLAHRLYARSNNNTRFTFKECFDYLKAFDKWNPKPTKQKNETNSERDVDRSERLEGMKRAKIWHALSQLMEDQLMELKSSDFIDKVIQARLLKMKEDNDIKLMMFDPSTIEQPHRRLWIERKQAEILKRDLTELK